MASGRLVVKVDKANKLMKLALSDGLREIADDSHFLVQRTYAVMVNMMSQKLQLLKPKQTLG